MSSEVSFVSKYEDSFNDFDIAVRRKDEVLQKFPFSLNDDFEYTAKMMVNTSCVTHAL